MYKNNLSTKHSIPIKQVSSNNQTIKKILMIIIQY